MSHISAIHCFRHANIAHICAHIGSTHCATSRGGRSTLAVAEPSGGDGSIQTCRRGGQGIWSGRVAATCGGERPDRPTHTPFNIPQWFGDWHAAPRSGASSRTVSNSRMAQRHKTPSQLGTAGLSHTEEPHPLHHLETWLRF